MAKIDFSELTEFESELRRLAQDLDKGKHAKKFLRKSGTKLKNKTVALAKSRVRKRTGNLFKGITRGKVYKYYKDGSLAVRVYGKHPANHLHLLNNGHRIVAPYTREEKGFAKGYHFMEDALTSYESEYQSEVEDLIDELLNEHLL